MELSQYKLLHLLGVFLVLVAYGTLTNAKLWSSGTEGRQIFKRASMGHGIGLLLILVAGFGMLARLGISGSWPLWVILKLVIWIFIGALIGVLKRRPHSAHWLVPAVILLTATAAYLGIYKVE